MSYDIRLQDPITQEVLELDEPHHMRGGTYQVGGTTQMRLNVTYNYSEHYYRVMKGAGKIDGIRAMYGISGAESIPLLTKAIEALGNDKDDDYWNPTEGNAKAALIQLRALAQMRPGGVWGGD